MAASFWPFLMRSAVSMVFISELGAVPTSAGRNSGSVDCGEGDGDLDFGVCGETEFAPSRKQKSQRSPIRMGK